MNYGSVQPLDTGCRIGVKTLGSGTTTSINSGCRLDWLDRLRLERQNNQRLISAYELEMKYVVDYGFEQYYGDHDDGRKKMTLRRKQTAANSIAAARHDSE